MKITLSLLFAALIGSVSAQKMYEGVDVSFGDLKLEMSSNVIIISTFKVDDGYVILKKEPIRGPGGFRYFIEKFDQDLKSQKTHDVSQQFEKDDFIIDQIMKIGDSYVLLTTKDFAAEKKEELYGQTFNWDSGKLSSPHLIFSQPYEGRRGGIAYNTSTSNDKKLLLLTIHPPYKKDQKESITFEVYDGQLDKLWSIEDLEFEEQDKNYSIQETLLSNEGQIYILGSKYTPEDKKRFIKRGEIEYEVITLSDGDKEITPVKTGEKIVDEIALIMSEDNVVYVGGYYRKLEGTGVDGVFLFTLNQKTGEIENEIWDEFTKEFITAGWSERKVGKADKLEERGKDLGLANLEFRSIIKHDDGSISMVGEVFWITTTTTTNSQGQTTTRTTYHYGDLIISKVSKEGEFSNQSRFKKHHTYYGAYTYFNLNNQVAMLMNMPRINLYDVDPETVEKKDKKAMSGNALTLIQISDDGEVTHEGILDYKDPKYVGYRQYKQIRNESFIMDDAKSLEILILTYYGKKQFGICKLDFKKSK